MNWRNCGQIKKHLCSRLMEWFCRTAEAWLAQDFILNYAEFTEFIPFLLQELLHSHSLRILRKDDIPGEPSYLNTACDLGTMPNFWHNARIVQIETLSKIDGVSLWKYCVYAVPWLNRSARRFKVQEDTQELSLLRSPASFDEALLRFEFPRS